MGQTHRESVEALFLANLGTSDLGANETPLLNYLKNIGVMTKTLGEAVELAAKDPSLPPLRAIILEPSLRCVFEKGVKSVHIVLFVTEQTPPQPGDTSPSFFPVQKALEKEFKFQLQGDIDQVTIPHDPSDWEQMFQFLSEKLEELAQIYPPERYVFVSVTGGTPAASAIKGCCRSLAFWELFENENIWADPPDESDAEALQECLIRPLPDKESEIANHFTTIWKKAGKDNHPIKNLSNFKELVLQHHSIFGSQKEAGLLLFLDAFPAGEYRLCPDIMNPHYPRYYRGESSQADDWEAPSPIYFLTVQNSTFQFHLLMDKYPAEKRGLSPQDLLEKVILWLSNALQKSGIGAKTTSGYGYWRDA